MTDHNLIYGPTKVFVPICIRHPLGFLDGPAGYEERTTEKIDTEPIIVDARDGAD